MNTVTHVGIKESNTTPDSQTFSSIFPSNGGKGKSPFWPEVTQWLLV